MRNIFLSTTFLLTLLVYFPVISQEIVFQEELDWSRYETPFSDEEKFEIVSKIDNSLIEFLTQDIYYQLNDKLKYFRFMDLNCDGKYEILYSGDAGTESNRTLLFQINELGIYEEVFGEFGTLIRIDQNYTCIPPTLVLRDDPCCMTISLGYRVFTVSSSFGRIEYSELASYWGVERTVMPDKYFDKPIVFRVLNETYNLRFEPKVEDEKIYTFYRFRGNSISVYTSGAIGYAIAETTDQTGRKWWFVIMTNNIPPTKSPIHNPHKNVYHSYGWMSSRFLEVIH